MLALGRKAMRNLGSILKSREMRNLDRVLKGRNIKAMVFPVVMYECQSWTIKNTERDITKNTYESVLMRWMKLELTIQSEVSQKKNTNTVY